MLFSVGERVPAERALHPGGEGLTVETLRRHL
jgi:hypothetical protein